MKFWSKGCGKNVTIKNNKIFAYVIWIKPDGTLVDLKARSNEIWIGSKTARIPEKACPVTKDSINDANYGKDTVWPLPGNIFKNLDSKYFSGTVQ